MTDRAKAAANRKAREERKKAHLRAMFERYASGFREPGNRIGPAIAREAHQTIEIVLERDRKRDANSELIKCRKGCIHCCHEPVEIWPQEAVLLVEAAREAGVTVDKARLERQSRYSVETWREQPAGDTACVFLGEDGACRVYEHRPNACRKLLVMTDPEFCDAGKHPPDRVGRWFSWEAEILESAALEVFGAGLMPQLLLDAQKAEKY